MLAPEEMICSKWFSGLRIYSNEEQRTADLVLTSQSASLLPRLRNGTSVCQRQEFWRTPEHSAPSNYNNYSSIKITPNYVHIQQKKQITRLLVAKVDEARQTVETRQLQGLLLSYGGGADRSAHSSTLCGLPHRAHCTSQSSS